MAQKIRLLVYLSAFTPVAPQMDWSAVAEALGSFSKETFKASKEKWQSEFERITTDVRGVRRWPKVFVPFSGGDVWSALAVNEWATEYTLADRWTAARHDDLRRWNATKLRAVAEGVQGILGGSDGFQLGIDVKAFAAQFGMAPLILGALGARNDVRVVHVHATRKMVMMRCQRKARFFLLRYVQADLHDLKDLDHLENILNRDALTLLKGTELALKQQRLSLKELRGAQDPVAIRNASLIRDIAADNATNMILRISRVIIQDSTGVPFRRLQSWAARLDLFGTYSNLYDARPDPDLSALASYFATHRESSRSIGSLRFGYCIGLDAPCCDQSPETALHHDPHYADLLRHAPLGTTLQPASAAAASDDNSGVPHRSPSSSSSSRTTYYFCHMLIAVCCKRRGSSSSSSSSSNTGRRR